MDEQTAGGQGEEIIVLGAGVAGLFAADWLSRAGHRVRVIEASQRVGGTHRSRQIGPYTFDVGSIFYEENARIFQLAPEIKQLCPQVHRRQRRIAPSGAILDYPFEPRELLRESPVRLALTFLDLAVSRFVVRRDGTLDAITRKRLGSRLLENTGLRAYMTRFHHVSPGEIDEAFFFHRMSYIERSTRFNALLRSAYRSLVLHQAADAGTGRALYVRPREGFDSLFAKVKDRLEQRGVRFVFGGDMQSIRREAGRFRVCTSQRAHHGAAVVSTVPLDVLHQALFGQPSGLVSLNMTTLFVSAAQLSPQAGNLLFNFHAEGLWKRATIYSRIYPEPKTDREFFNVEVTIPPGGRHDPDMAFADFRDHITRLGVAGDLALEGSELVEAAYPVYAVGAQAQIDALLKKIADAGIITVGRQGRFEYLPTSSRVNKRVCEELELAEFPATHSNP